MRSVHSVGWNAAAEQTAGNVDHLQEFLMLSDDMVNDVARQGESDVDRDARLARLGGDIDRAWNRWVESAPPAFATRMRQADAAARVAAARAAVEAAGVLVEDDVGVALDALAPFVETLPDGSSRLVDRLPDGRRFADQQPAINDLVASIRLRRLLGRPMTTELAQHPFMRLLHQAGHFHIADAALAEQLGVPVSPPLRAA